jgi:molybdopterin/thiamine biosynthesis adenylyltransferase
MILSKDQITRYLRHIIIPEISGSGQKKIMESKIYLYAANVEEASPLIYYLAASGVCFISCYFKHNKDYEKLFNNIRDLNGDVFIQLADRHLLKDAQINGGSVIRIFTSKYEDLEDNLVSFKGNEESSNFIPTIVAINSGWKGFLQTFSNLDDFNSFFSSSIPIDLNSTEDIIEGKESSILSNCLLSALTVMECLKLSLNMGTVLTNPLHFNLLSMEFSKAGHDTHESSIYDFLKNNYSKTTLPVDLSKPGNSKNLSDCKVLIVGTGGLGSPVAYALSSLGIGTLGVVDYDKVELSNLNRQILHSASRIDMPKVESAKIFIDGFNPKVKVVTYNTSINIGNAIDIIKDYDVVIDALDNFPARYLLNDACYLENKPLVDAAAVKFHGLIMTILPNMGPCYRCIFPVTASQKPAMSCSEAGILGPVTGVMGFIQAAEVVKLLLNIGETLSHRVIYYDALDSDFDTINMKKSSNCDLCGPHKSLSTLTEYNTSCVVNKKKDKGIS